MGVVSKFLHMIITDLTSGRIKTPYHVNTWYGHRIVAPANWIHAINNEWERESRLYVEANAKHGDVAIDVGACFGLYTILFSKLVGDDGFVYAFEPDISMFRLLRENVRRCGLHNVEIHNVALSDSERVSDFYITSAGRSSLNPMLGVQSVISAKVKTLDSFGFERVDWMKLDTEGTEHLVLDGGQDTILRCNPKMIIELIPEFGNSHLLLARLKGREIHGYDNNIIC